MYDNLVGKKVAVEYGPSSQLAHVEVLQVTGTHMVTEDSSGRIKIFPWTSVNAVTISKGQVTNDFN